VQVKTVQPTGSIDDNLDLRRASRRRLHRPEYSSRDHAFSGLVSMETWSYWQSYSFILNSTRTVSSAGLRVRYVSLDVTGHFVSKHQSTRSSGGS
jgi:hypothetical protein